MIEKIKLADGPEKTVTWIWLEAGQLKVELYDFSETAQKIFGNDFAQIITVKDMDKIYSKMEKDETTLLPWMEQYFKSYFGIKQWLEENGVEFRVERENWA
ncbi:MAG: hypothetical protein QM730_13385 [Anaerolineales bacterium]